ncbi:MAG: acyl-CoA dehydrogenase family protein [Acidimicrobiales bacterium]
MEFTPNPDHEAIREGVRKVCSDFPDTYWADMDERHEFPWDFYNAMAAGGWIGVCIPPEYGGAGQGITEATIILEEVARSGAAMNGCSAIHLSIFGMNGGQVRLGRAAQVPPAGGEAACTWRSG